MPTFDSQVKFQKIPVSQLVVEQAAAASAPASPIVGQLWFDTTNSQLKVCTNATGPVWTQCDNVIGGIASNVQDGDKGDITIASGVWTIDNGVVSLAKLATDSVDSSKIVAGGVAYVDLNADTKDQVAGTSSMRSLGTGTQQAAAGNDARLSDQRVPTDNSVTTVKLVDGNVTLAKLAAAIVPTSSGGTALQGAAAVRALGLSTDQAMPGATNLNLINAPTADLNLNSKKIISLADGVSASDGVNKGQLDAMAQGLDSKPSVLARVTTPPGSWSGTQWTSVPITLDGIGGFSVGARFLVDLGTNSSGIFTWGAGDLLIRATDFDNWNEIPGAYVFVEQGTSDNNGYTCTNNAGGTLNTTAITFTQFSGAGQITDGIGLLKTGNTLDVRLDGSTIEAPSDILQVKAGGITNGHLSGGITGAKLATGAVDLATATVTGVLGTAKGGTGADASTLGGQQNARSNLGAVGLYATNSPALTAGTWATITHNLGARARNVSFEEVSTGEGRILDWRVNSGSPGTQVDIRCDIVGGRAASYYTVNVMV